MADPKLNPGETLGDPVQASPQAQPQLGPGESLGDPVHLNPGETLGDPVGTSKSAAAQIEAAPPGIPRPQVDMQKSAVGTAYQNATDSKSELASDNPELSKGFVKPTSDALSVLPDFAKGAGKNAIIHVQGLDHLVRHFINSLPGTNQEKDKNGRTPMEARDLEDEKLRKVVEPKNLAETMGGGAEDLLEWVALGPEEVAGKAVAKGTVDAAAHYQQLAGAAKFLYENPKLASLAAFGLNNLRQAAFAGLQSYVSNGGDVNKALETGGWVGGTNVLLHGLGAASGATLRRLFATGDEVSKMQAAADETARLATKKGNEIATDIGGEVTKSQRDVVTTLQDHLDNKEKEMYQTYSDGMDKATTGKNIPAISIDGSDLKKAADDIYNSDGQISKPWNDALNALRKPERERIEPLLSLIQNAGSDAKGAAPGTVPFEELQAIRQRLGNEIRQWPGGPDANPIRRELISLRQSLDSTAEKAATAAGHPEVAEDIAKVRSAYAQDVHRLETNAISSFREKNPNNVAKLLMNTDSVWTVGELRSLIGPDKMKAVEGGMFQNMINQSLDEANYLRPDFFARRWRKMDPEVKQAIWGDRTKDVNEFVSTLVKDAEHAQNEVQVATNMRDYGMKALTGATYAGRVAALTSAGYYFIKGDKDTGAALALPALLGGKIMKVGVELFSNPVVMSGVTKMIDKAAPLGKKALFALETQLVKNGATIDDIEDMVESPELPKAEGQPEEQPERDTTPAPKTAGSL